MLPDVRISPAPHASALFTAPDARGEGLVRAEEGPGIADPKSADNEPAAFPLRHCAPPPPEPGEEKKERERETQARFFLKNAIVRSQAILACASL